MQCWGAVKLIGSNRRTIRDMAEEEPQPSVQHTGMFINVILVLLIFFLLLIAL